VQFTFIASDSQPITYTWDFGDGTIETTTATSLSHTFLSPGAYNITVTASDPSGNSVSGSMSLTVSDNVNPGGGDICDGLNPVDLQVKKISIKLKFPSTLLKDSLALKALVQLNDGFAPLNQEVKWEIAEVTGSVVLDVKGNSPKSPSLKVSVKYKKPAKGAPFTARVGKLSIAMKTQALTGVTLGGIATLNATSALKTGDPASADCCAVLTGHQAYHLHAVAGLYKAKLDKGGAFAAKFK